MALHPTYPDVLMTTDAVAGVLNDPSYRFVEVNMDPEAYSQGHLHGAIGWDWERELRNTETHEILSPEEFTDLLGRSGIGPDEKVVLYGDNNNWFACWAYWLFSMMGHKNVWLMDGGAKKWFAEGRAVTSDVPLPLVQDYPLKAFDLKDKATTENIFEAFFNPNTHRLVDVRSAAEYEGRALGPAGVEARCATGGHIPTAINIPWSLNCNSDGTFKAAGDLRDVYASFDIRPENVVITYCAIGERASLSWFVLRKLLKHDIVMNYDRSMAQWTRLSNAPMISGIAA